MTEPDPDEAGVADLVTRAARGEPGALRDLVEGYRTRIHRWALAVTADPDEADDVTQTVLVKLHRSLGSFRGRSAFSTWLYRVTRNAAIDRLRRRHEATSLEDVDEETLPVETTDPAADVDRRRLATLVQRYLGELSPRQREVFDLTDLQGLSPQEVAGLLELEPATVRVHLLRARRAIRTRMLERHPEWTEEYER